jgi:hypothetical protein
LKAASLFDHNWLFHLLFVNAATHDIGQLEEQVLCPWEREARGVGVSTGVYIRCLNSEISSSENHLMTGPIQTKGAAKSLLSLFWNGYVNELLHP